MCVHIYAYILCVCGYFEYVVCVCVCLDIEDTVCVDIESMCVIGRGNLGAHTHSRVLTFMFSLQRVW